MPNTNIQTTIDRLRSASRWEPKKDLAAKLAQAPYLYVRTTDEFGDYTITSDIVECRAVHFRVGYANRDAELVASIEDVVEAVDIALEFRRLNPDCLVWYHGSETYVEITSWSDLVYHLRDRYTTDDPDEPEDWVPTSDEEARKLIAELIDANTKDPNKLLDRE